MNKVPCAVRWPCVGQQDSQVGGIEIFTFKKTDWLLLPL